MPWTRLTTAVDIRRDAVAHKSTSGHCRAIATDRALAPNLGWLVRHQGLVTEVESVCVCVDVECCDGAQALQSAKKAE